MIKPAWQFHCPVRIGEELDRFVKPVSGWKRRECYQHLRAYIYGDMQDRDETADGFYPDTGEQDAG